MAESTESNNHPKQHDNWGKRIADVAVALVEKVKALESMLRRTWAHHQGELRILVTGKTGQGKSTLINGILGDNIVTEGAGAKRCTTKVEMFSKTVADIPIKVFDSPGLQDGTENEEEYIRGMKKTCQSLSLVLYCTKMGNTRLTDEDKNAMIKLTRAFGEDFWNYAVFVLTFTNKEDVSRKDDRDGDEVEPEHHDEKGWKELEKRRFQGRLKLWEKELQRFLIEEVGVSPKIADRIPVVPTGDHKKTRNNPHPLSLPDRKDWFNDFWEACCLRVKDTVLFLQINSDRMVAEDAEDDGEEGDEEDSLPLTPEDDKKQMDETISASSPPAEPVMKETISASSPPAESVMEETISASSPPAEPVVVEKQSVLANHLADQEIHINNEFVAKVTEEAILRAGGSARDFKKVFSKVKKPCKWFVRMIKKIKNRS